MDDEPFQISAPHLYSRKAVRVGYAHIRKVYLNYASRGIAPDSLFRYRIAIEDNRDIRVAWVDWDNFFFIFSAVTSAEERRREQDDEENRC